MAKTDKEIGRNWSTIVYPESAPDGWINLLVGYKVPCFVSPLHDLDLKEDGSGELKKEHYHVMVMFEGNKSRSQMEEIFSSFGGVGAERVESQRGMARYLCHLDDPDKFVYSTAQVQSFCGADYDHVVNLPKDRYNAVREMIIYCIDHGVTSYASLLTYAMYHNNDWFRSLCDNSSFVMKEFIRSLREGEPRE